MFFYVHLFSWSMNFVHIWPVFIFPNIVKKKISSVFNFAKLTKFAKNIHAKISALNAHRFSFSQKLLYTKSCSGRFRFACLNVFIWKQNSFFSLDNHIWTFAKSDCFLLAPTSMNKTAIFLQNCLKVSSLFGPMRSL